MQTGMGFIFRDSTQKKNTISQIIQMLGVVHSRVRIINEKNDVKSISHKSATLIKFCIP